MSFSSTKYKDRNKYIEAREKYKSKYRMKTGAFKWWSRFNDNEVRMIMEHSISDRELSEKIKHSVSSIQRKRWEMKKKNVEVQ